jgi:Protein of unknown function (DUF962)
MQGRAGMDISLIGDLDVYAYNLRFRKNAEFSAALNRSCRGGVPRQRSTIPRMLGGRSWESWIAEYSQSHQHPLNRLSHTFGIPMILASLAMFLVSIVWHGVLWYAVALFRGGMDTAVRRACDRGQASGVLQGLEISAGGLALVGGEDSRQGLSDRGSSGLGCG